jgi:type I pantothenate kinase
VAPTALGDLARAIAGVAAGGTRPVLVGIGGAVAVGKSTLAAQLPAELAAFALDGQVLCTDCFLHPNDVLAERGITMRKGFPESFDTDAVAAVLDAVLAGHDAIDVPVYSHTTYDIVPGARERLAAADVVIVEGVNALWPPVRERLHVAVYLDAPEDVVRGWFLDRFEGLCVDPPQESVYRAIAELPRDQQRAIAESAWDGINLVNLREHIAPSRSVATHVIEKDRAHRAVRLTPQ